MSMFPPWVRPGVKVVCVSRTRLHLSIIKEYDLEDAVVGQVYTIRDTMVRFGQVGILLAEIRNNSVPGDSIEWGFSVERFRPLITRTQEQDLEQFIPLLETKPHEVDA